MCWKFPFHSLSGYEAIQEIKYCGGGGGGGGDWKYQKHISSLPDQDKVDKHFFNNLKTIKYTYSRK